MHHRACIPYLALILQNLFDFPGFEIITYCWKWVTSHMEVKIGRGAKTPAKFGSAYVTDLANPRKEGTACNLVRPRCETADELVSDVGASFCQVGSWLQSKPDQPGATLSWGNLPHPIPPRVLKVLQNNLHQVNLKPIKKDCPGVDRPACTHCLRSRA